MESSYGVESFPYLLFRNKSIRIFANVTSHRAEIAHKPHFVLMNLAIGGSFPNKDYGADATPLESTKSGGVYQAEYVAVYNSA